jgi:hypothetical protein
MACQTLSIGGGTVIACSRGRKPKRCFCCIKAAGFQCDWKVVSGTCDRHICSEHAHPVSGNKHLCPQHRKEYEAWRARKGGDAA